MELLTEISHIFMTVIALSAVLAIIGLIVCIQLKSFKTEIKAEIASLNHKVDQLLSRP